MKYIVFSDLDGTLRPKDGGLSPRMIEAIKKFQEAGNLFVMTTGRNRQKAEEFAKEYGGKLTAKWIFGMVICDENGAENYSWTKDHFYFVDNASKVRNPGYPLESISVIPEFNKYAVELNEEEKQFYKKKDNIDNVVEFIVNSIHK